MQLTAVLATLTKSASALNDVRFLLFSVRCLTNMTGLKIVNTHLLLVAPEGKGDGGHSGAPGNYSGALGMSSRSGPGRKGYGGGSGQSLRSAGKVTAPLFSGGDVQWGRQ